MYRGGSRLSWDRPFKLDWETYFNPIAYLVAEYSKDRLSLKFELMYSETSANSPFVLLHMCLLLCFKRRERGS